ncbi:hypothetical protein H9N25_11875 [Pedobacter riviphilus]|uniref:PA14 domain-containing protein n=1 Tax=Pedobacter riviphilus TaxID=2766984 RepID=A0ABX6TNL2_9SPHI|nr:hypothetical protein [Pedobacter riviphilus]QNR87023.1 hypothetical protein H9N25_11875 [Pedobacter riviphilus]
MNNRFRSNTKKIARVLLAVWVLNLIEPFSAYALTSGPSQPESQSFQPAGVSDMVDVFSGDFKYNIPLMDIDGYPVNLNYQSGVSMDDEASWVGLGWNLNVGSINRQLRGIPDDFNGDLLLTEQQNRDRITVGGRLTGKMEVRGKYVNRLASETKDLAGKKLKISGSFTFGIFSDNYTGIGAEIGANAGISYSFGSSGLLTSNLGLGVLSNTASGVDVSPYISASIASNRDEKQAINSGLTSSLGYNSRAGLKTFNFGANSAALNVFNGSVSYNTEPIQLKVQKAYASENYSFSVDAGPSETAIFWGGGATGYWKKLWVANHHAKNPEYGFLYSERGKNDVNALHDFIREKENPIIPELPNLALPIATPDIFTFNSQVGSGQFRLYRGGSGMFYDNQAVDGSKNNSFGVDLGFGFTNTHIGFTLFKQSATNTTGKWTRDNAYATKGDFQDQDINEPQKQHVFFRKPDEKNIEDVAMHDKIHGTEPLMINTWGKTANAAFKTSNSIASNIYQVNDRIEKNKRQEQSTAISYLTAAEASKAGLDKMIKNYPFNNFGAFYPNLSIIPDSSSRINNEFRKAHHISEITVLNEQGQRSVYGLPVYNKRQEEITFAVDNGVNNTNGRVSSSNLYNVNTSGVNGTDNYFHWDTQPGYASSYLLTGILSPDYVDKEGDGITPDDNGTAIKFNYSKIDSYKWRTPYNLGSNPEAALNRGLLADPKDDKGSIIYGEKEIYYVHSIESKTKIAYFITEDREDALGVQNVDGAKDPSVRQKRLREIRLYSRANMDRPIKVIKFKYNYNLCPGVPNTVNGGGKLTLEQVWFEYGSTQKGANHPYVFHYDANAAYGAQMVDRWGVYKNQANNYGSLNNEQYPYSDQNRERADQAAALWHLNRIELPSGGKINVTYEADDYAYVQDKKATTMVPFDFVAGKNITDTHNSIVLPIDSTPPETDTGDATDWFKRVYLNGSDYIYTKSAIKMSTSNAPSEGNDNDFVSAYAKVKHVNVSNNHATIELADVTEDEVTTNPIRFAAWQKLKNEYPRYAYPGYENRVSNGTPGIAAVWKAISSATRNLSELWQGFYSRAARGGGKGFCENFYPAQSFARIAKASTSKTGGGARVKQIQIEDDWDTFTDGKAPKGTYGQRYEYTTKGDDGRTISSGVATYEPSVGNDENALKQPIPYIQKIKGAVNNFFELEAPFGESLYPAPSVGYSRIVVKDLEGTGAQPNIPATGYTVHEFYTAKDFPVRVTVLPIESQNSRPKAQYSWFQTESIEEQTMSQGYSIELNDMHGKPSADRVFNASSAEISSNEYHYQVDNEKEKSLKLNNKVKVVKRNGDVVDAVVGRDIEFFTDFREQESINSGTSVGIGADIIHVGFIIVPLPHLPVNANNEYKLFRSACAVKVIQTNGILSKVTKKENGSSITVENVAYDGTTGAPLVTKTQNEFNKNYYTVNLPAYWPYRRMGGAYQNIGMLLQNVTLNNNFEVSPHGYLLTQGDELVNLGTGLHYWAVDNRPAVNIDGSPLYFWAEPSKILVDKKGARLSSITGGDLNHSFKVVRSGFRNILDASAQNIVCLNNPIQDGVLSIASSNELSALKVFNASSTVYSDEWPVDGTGQATEIKENKLSQFKYILAPTHSGHGSQNCRIYVESFGEGDLEGEWARFNNDYLRHRESNTGIWPDTGIPESLNEAIGFKTTFYVDKSDYYYVGFAGDDRLNIKIDEVNFIDNSFNNTDYWSLRSKYLNEGYHTIEIEGYNIDHYGYIYNPHNSWAENPGVMSVEIYKNTENELRTATSASSLNTVFSTGNLLANQLNFQTFRTINGVKTWRFTYETYFNPFVHGMKGNWRPYQQNVYQENRSYDNILTSGKKGINVSNSGYLNFFKSYWIVQNGDWVTNTSATKWVSTNTIKQYDKYGQEAENQDALKRYSAASFDFAGALPSAVASNAMRREIFSNSFEDVSRMNTVPDTSATKELTLINGQPFVAYPGDNTFRVSAEAHSGNYSLRLPNTGIRLSTKKHFTEQKDVNKPYLTKTSKYEFSLMPTFGLYPSGFEPKPGNPYLISFWIKDNQPLDRDIRVAVNVGNANASTPVYLNFKAAVEGWKQVVGTFSLPSSSGNNRFDVNIYPTSGTVVYLDDIRIHPNDAHMKTYVYNEKNYKLMAELDENAFATFYEYDDEGSLIRVKKETERGIATIKENHSSYRKRITASN